MKKKFTIAAKFVGILAIVFFNNSIQAQTPAAYTWQEIKSVDFGTGANYFNIKAASSGSGGEVELRLDAANGPVIGRAYFHHTGNAIHFIDYECKLNQTVTGVKNVYMSFQDYTQPIAGGVLKVGNFQFTLVNTPPVIAGDRLHVYPPVPGLAQSEYYEYKVQKVSALNSSSLAAVTNWETPFSWFTKTLAGGANKSAYFGYIANWTHTYCNFEMDDNTPIVVKITRLNKTGAPSGPILLAAAHPVSKVQSCQIINGDVYVTMNNPAQVTIDIDGQMDGRNTPRPNGDMWNFNVNDNTEMKGVHAVSIFANPFIKNKPDPFATNVKRVFPGDKMPADDGSWSTLYFMPGIHKMSVDAGGNEREWLGTDVYKINSNRQYYIPGDAIVYGNFNDKDWIDVQQINVRLFGHGTLSGAKMTHWQDFSEAQKASGGSLRVCEIAAGKNCIIEGITVADPAEHGIYIYADDNDNNPNYIKWVKMISWRVNNDGMVVNGNSFIEDCFLRHQDDAFYTTGRGISRCVLWSDVNGMPFRGEGWTNSRLVVEDIDVIYARGMWGGSIFGSSGTWSVGSVGDGTVNTAQHIVFRNINVEDPRPVRNLLSIDNEKDSNLVLRGARFENVNYQHPQAFGNNAGNLNGNNTNYLKYFTFDNVYVAGKRVDGDFMSKPANFSVKNAHDLTYRLYYKMPSTGYTLTTTAIGGSILVNTETGTPGNVSLTATPEKSYRFSHWSGDLTGTNSTAAIAMNTDKGITANFTLIAYTIGTSAAHGTITLDPKLDVYREGTVVTVKTTSNLGYKFNSWGGDLSGTTKDRTITISGDMNISANFDAIPTYTFTTSATNGSISIDQSGSVFNEGTNITLEAKPAYGYEFSGWRGTISGKSNPISILMNEDQNITAIFTELTGTTSVAINCGGPAFIASDGITYTADANFSSGGTYAQGVSIAGTTDDNLYQTERFGDSFSYNITAPNGLYHVMLRFAEIFHTTVDQRIFNVAIENAPVINNLDIVKEAGAKTAYNTVHYVNVTDGVLNISFTGIKDKAKISAIKIFKIENSGNFTLTDNSTSGGSVDAVPSKPFYSYGEVVTLTANPYTGNDFTGWSGDLTDSAKSTTITMNSNISFTANFTDGIVIPTKIEAENYVTKSGIVVEPCNEGGSNVGYIDNGDWMEYRVNVPTASTFTIDYRVASPNTGGKILCLNASGQTLSTTNVPDTGGWQSWSTISSTSFSLPAGTNVIRIKASPGGFNLNWIDFKYLTYNLTLSKNPAVGGNVTANPSKELYLPGDVITLNATANAGYTFAGWSGDITGSVNATTITMNADKNIAANFSYVGLTLPFTINCGGASYLSSSNENYYADTNFVGGFSASRNNPISGTTDDVLYQSERAGNIFKYTIPVPNGNYAVTLKFAELYFTATGKRLFNTTIESTPVLNNFDIFAQAGGANTAIDKTFNVTVTDGILNIAFASVVDNAKISAIKITSAPDVTPTFTAVPQSCYGETLTPLPTTSNNGITGTWSPALNNLATTTYTFTPTAGQFATSTTLTLVIGGSTTWNNNAWTNGAPNVNTKAIIAGNYSQAFNLTACSLEVTGTAVVVVPLGFNFTISGKVTVAPTASFTLENNTNLIQVGNSQNAGNITIKRNSAPLMRLDYTLWSSPVTNASQFLTTFSPLTATNRFYTYNASTNFYNEVVSPSSTPFNRGTGYLIRMPNTHPASPAIWTGSFTGVPNNGTIAIAVANNTFNAIGNPYPSSISANAFIDANTLVEPLYFWRKTNNTAYTSYATYTKAGGTANSGGSSSIVPNGVIQIGQGFIAKSTSSTIAFNNAMRTANNDNQFLKTKEIERHRIWLNLSKESEPVNQMMVAYIAGATAAIDLAIDGRYFGDSPVALNSSIGNQEFVIQAKGLPFENTDAIPLIFKTNSDGNYTISIDHVDGLFLANQDIFLKDNLIGVTQNLKEKAYSFTSSIGTFNTRFELVYKSNITLGTDLKEFNSDKIIVYKENGTLKINAGKTIMKNVHLYDIQGRLLFKQENINQNITKLEGFKAINQTILVKITSFEGKVIAEKIIFGEVK